MELNIQTGLKTFQLNDKVEVSFNPTDTRFVKKLQDTFVQLENKREEYDELLQGKTTFEAMEEMDKSFRAIINTLFDKDICTPLFGEVNVNALADGMPLWVNLYLAIIDVVDGELKDAEKPSERLQKYVEKYKK